MIQSVHIGANSRMATHFWRENAESLANLFQDYASLISLCNRGVVPMCHHNHSGTNCQNRYPSPRRSAPPKVRPAHFSTTCAAGPCAVGQNTADATAPFTQNCIVLLANSLDCIAHNQPKKGSHTCLKFVLSWPQRPLCRLQHASTTIWNAALRAPQRARSSRTQLVTIPQRAPSSAARAVSCATTRASVTNFPIHASGRLTSSDRRQGPCALAAVLHSKDHAHVQ